MKLTEVKDHTKALLVCIAGNLCDPRVFSQITVPANIEICYLDYLRGTGPWDMDSMGYQLLEIINNLSVPIVLAGYSAGGVLAMSAASKSPSSIAGLVLSNTGPCSIGHGNPNFPTELSLNYNNEEYIRKFLTSCFAQKISKAFEDQLWHYTRTVNCQAAYHVSKSLREADYRDGLKKFDNPVALIHGQLDTRRKLNSVETMKECMPQAEVTLLQTGHTPMWEDPIGYQNALDALLSKIK